MSGTFGFRGRGARGSGRGGFRGGRGGVRGGAGFRGGGGFRGGRGGGSFSYGPPQDIVEVGRVLHPCESQLMCKCTLEKQVPYFNGRIFLENKEEIGKVDEILGPINEFYFSVNLGDGMKAESFAWDTKFYIDSQQVLPLSRFLPNPLGARGQKNEKGLAGGRGGGRGGRGGGFGSRGRGRGGSSFSRGGRGSFSGNARGGRGGFGSLGGRGR